MKHRAAVTAVASFLLALLAAPCRAKLSQLYQD